jgi:hypothetical protein
MAVSSRMLHPEMVHSTFRQKQFWRHPLSRQEDYPTDAPMMPIISDPASIIIRNTRRLHSPGQQELSAPTKSVAHSARFCWIITTNMLHSAYRAGRPKKRQKIIDSPVTSRYKNGLY